MHRKVMIAVSAILGAMLPSAHAVVLNPHGTGQVLVYPYYTVNAGFGTLLSLVNTTDEGKALKVRIHEGYNGRDVLVFNLYLSPFDAWVAQIFDTSTDASGGAAIATNDNSCTVPAFPKTFGPAPGSGAGAAAFLDAGYTGTNADGGPTSITRTREGYIEIIEMGTVTNDEHSTLNAITHGSRGMPSSCSQLIKAWTTGGYWTTDATTDIGPPDGGLFGAESIINVGEGLLYTVNAEAIDGFSNAAQHTLPSSATPDLSSASTSVDGTVSAFVPVGSAMVEAKYDRPEDAISALFMVDALYNEYVVDPGLNAMTDWIVTFPTKRFYTDPALAGSTARAPFDIVFGTDVSAPAAACSPLAYQYFSREELTTTSGVDFAEPFPQTAAVCYATTLISFLGSSLLGSALVREGYPYPSIYAIADPSVFPAGHARFDFTHNSNGVFQTAHTLTSRNSVTFTGLPAIGFAAIDYVNGNVTPGTLANYSGAYPHRSTVNCMAGANPPPACAPGGTP